MFILVLYGTYHPTTVLLNYRVPLHIILIIMMIFVSPLVVVSLTVQMVRIMVPQLLVVLSIISALVLDLSSRYSKHSSITTIPVLSGSIIFFILISFPINSSFLRSPSFFVSSAF